MTMYDNKTFEPTKVKPWQEGACSIYSHEYLNLTNDGLCKQWAKGNQQPIKKKCNGQGIHICGWISEEISHLRLSEEQITALALHPEDQCLEITDSCKINYTGKGHNDW